MDNRIKILIGAAIGGALGYLTADIIIAKREMDKEAAMLGDAGKDESFFYQPKREEKSDNMKNKTRSRKGKPRDYTEHFDPKMKEDLAKLAAKYNGGVLATVDEPVGVLVDPNDIVEEPEEDFPDEDADRDVPTIQIITLEEFTNSVTGYDQEDLSYYEDDIVTDQDDEPVANIDSLIGEDALVSFDEDDYVHVRNNTLEIEYRILRKHANYGAEDIVVKPRTASIKRKEQEEEDENDEDD